MACSPERAFEVWATRTSAWWPRDHTVSGAAGLTVTFEPRRGGRIYERTPEGVEHDWGEVLRWEPPRRLAYRWHLGSRPGDATEVEVTFAAAGAGTAVTVVHRGWERLGAAGADLRRRNELGWGGLLPHFAAGCLAGPRGRPAPA